MEDLEMISQLGKMGSPAMIAMAIIYFARQLRSSILKLEEAIEVIDKSLTTLNLTLTKLIVERDTDRKDIDAIKADIKQINWRFENGNKGS